MGRAYRDLAASGEAELRAQGKGSSPYFDGAALTARQKYRRFFADWQKKYGRPHSLEARWNADNEGQR